MSEQVITDLYNVICQGMTEISDLMKSYNDRISAANRIAMMQQDQIVLLKKRIEFLEERVKEQPCI